MLFGGRREAETDHEAIRSLANRLPDPSTPGKSVTKLHRHARKRPPLAKLLFDRDVAAGLTPELAVEAARRAVVDAYEGRLHAPPRLIADVGEGELVFTAGGYPGGTRGVRIYQTKLLSSDQAVLVWDGDGRMAGCVVGFELGIRRTGALGAVAADALARPDAELVAVIGSGRQAWAQLWALTSVRAAKEVRVYSLTEAHRAAFAKRARRELGLSSRARG